VDSTNRQQASRRVTVRKDSEHGRLALGTFALRGEHGYSIVEAVVTITIITILSGLVLSGVITARRNAAVRSSSQQFAGHLREAATLAQSSVKAPGCGSDQQCSQYEVTFTAGSSSYTRQTPNGFGVISYRLLGGVIFQDGGTITFEYQPPVVTASSQGSYRLRHMASASAQVFVCVGPLGGVEVRPTGC